MKKIFIYISELDYSMHICSELELGKFEKEQNKQINVSPKLKIKPWSLICNIEFPREQSAVYFKHFLQTKHGIKFAYQNLFFNPLFELKKLLAVLPKSVHVFVLGGLALDGYLGEYTRPHNDADLICWRKDAKTVKNALIKLGYKVREHCLEDNPQIPYYIETDEDNPTITFFIIDEAPNNSFKFNSINLHKIFSKEYLEHKRVSLEGVGFTPVSLLFLDYLNKEGAKGLAKIKKNNPKLYKILGVKIANNKNDRKLINKLLKK